MLGFAIILVRLTFQPSGGISVDGGLHHRTPPSLHNVPFGFLEAFLAVSELARRFGDAAVLLSDVVTPVHEYGMIGAEDLYSC